MRSIMTVTLLAAMLTLCSCAVGRVRHDPGAGAPLADFVGIWRGTSTSTMSAAKVRISLDVARKDGEFKGTYRCAPYNANCRNNIRRGWARGKTTARTFKIEMQDSSWCLFTLNQFFPPLAKGDYTCYMSGSIVDQGVFKLKGPPVMPEERGRGGKPQG